MYEQLASFKSGRGWLLFLLRNILLQNNRDGCLKWKMLKKGFFVIYNVINIELHDKRKVAIINQK